MNVSEAEWAQWEALRVASGRKEMGAWARAVILDALGMGGPGSRVGDLPVVPEVNRAAYDALMGATNNLNQLTRYSHQSEALAPGVLEAVAVVKEAALAVRGRGPKAAAVALLAFPGARHPREGGGVDDGDTGDAGDPGDAAAGVEG